MWKVPNGGQKTNIIYIVIVMWQANENFCLNHSEGQSLKFCRLFIARMIRLNG